MMPMKTKKLNQLYILLLKKNFEISSQNGPEHETTSLNYKFHIYSLLFFHKKYFQKNKETLKKFTS